MKNASMKYSRRFFMTLILTLTLTLSLCVFKFCQRKCFFLLLLMAKLKPCCILVRG